MPDGAVAVGAPARVVRNRLDDWAASAQQRAAHERALRDIERKKSGRARP